MADHHRQASLGFTGELTDPTGLVYLRARTYNPSLGIFTSRDPVLGIAGLSASYNGYGYVHGNPVNLTDPSGECLFCLIPLILAWLPASAGAVLVTASTVAATVVGAAGTAYFATRIIDAGFQQVGQGYVDWGRNKAAGVEGAVLGVLGAPFGALLAGFYRGALVGGLGNVTARVGTALMSAGVGASIGFAWDRNVMGRDPGTSLITNIAGSLVGESVGYLFHSNADSAAGDAGGHPTLIYESERASSNMVNQLETMSCGLACDLQILRERGITLNEGDLIPLVEGYDPHFGVRFEDLTVPLNVLLQGADFRSIQTNIGSATDTLERLTRSFPGWIAALDRHAVLVDAIDEHGLIWVRDPWGLKGPGTGMGSEGSMTIENFVKSWKNGRYWAIYERSRYR